MWERFVDQCVVRPQYQLLSRAYQDYRGNSRPCGRGVPNQCAVRMSMALVRSGFGLESFQPAHRVHSGNGACNTNGVPHVLAALELGHFLRLGLGAPATISPRAHHRGCAHAFEQIRGQKGILYFNNCFTRAGAAVQSGDHIDLFDGQHYFNEIIHPHAGGDETTGGDLFGRADQVWFWRLD